MNNEEHDFDFLSDFCARCGAGPADILRGLRSPECNDGVVAISHIIARRSFRPLERHVLGNMHPDWIVIDEYGDYPPWDAA